MTENDEQITYVEFFNVDLKAVEREARQIAFEAREERLSTSYFPTQSPIIVR